MSTMLVVAGITVMLFVTAVMVCLCMASKQWANQQEEDQEQWKAILDYEEKKKAKRRFVIPGTEGHPGYGFKAWMKGYALPEHLLQWPLLLCPLMAAAQAGLCLLLQKI